MAALGDFLYVGTEQPLESFAAHPVHVFRIEPHTIVPLGPLIDDATGTPLTLARPWVVQSGDEVILGDLFQILIVSGKGARREIRQRIQIPSSIYNYAIRSIGTVTGDRLAVGFPEHRALPEDVGGAGSVAIYRRTAGSWTFDRLLRETSYTGMVPPRFANFGSSVAFVDGQLAVGTRQYSADVISYGRTWILDDDGMNWTAAQRLTASGGAPFDGGNLFGSSIITAPGRLIIGAPGVAGGRIEAYMRTASEWTYTDALAGDLFIRSNLSSDGTLAPPGNALALARNQLQGDGNTNHRLTLIEIGSQPMRELGQLDPPSDAGSTSRFGADATAAGSWVFVAAPLRPHTVETSGSVYVYDIGSFATIQADGFESPGGLPTNEGRP